MSYHNQTDVVHIRRMRPVEKEEETKKLGGHLLEKANFNNYSQNLNHIDYGIKIKAQSLQTSKILFNKGPHNQKYHRYPILSPPTHIYMPPAPQMEVQLLSS